MPSRELNKKRKNILAVNFFPAFTPPKSGGELRYFHLYRFLREYYDIHMVNPTHLFVQPEEVLHFPYMIEHRVPKNKYHLFFHRAFDVLGGFKECSAVAVMAASCFDKSLKKKINEYLPQADIVIQESPFLIHLTPKQEGQILIYNSYNVEYHLQKDMLKGLLGRSLSAWVRHNERRACHTADLVFATSEEDRQCFSELYDISPRKIILVPNGVDPEEITPATPEERLDARKKLLLGEEPVFLFIGSAHPPNIEAGTFIVTELAPRFPQAVFLLAGNVCKNLEIRPSANVRLLGPFTNEEKRTILHAADIAMNPMFSGSGTNLKMFDYLSAGLPILATPVGARGIPIRNYLDALVMESSGFFAAAAQLLAHPALRHKISFHAREMVKEKFHWKRLAERVHNSIEDLSKPHVTVINDFPILPPRHGGQYRILSLYRELSRFLPVTYLCLDKESQDIEETSITEHFTQLSIPKTFSQRVFESMLNRILGCTIDDILGIFFAHRNRLLRREVNQAAKFGDILISVHPYLWQVLKSCRDKIRIYESLNYETQLKKETLKGFWGRLLISFVRRAEQKALSQSTAVLTVSDDEGEAYVRDFQWHKSWITIPNGTDTSRVVPASFEEKKNLRRSLDLPDCPIALFVGSAHPPNVEAGTLLVERIAPQTPEVLFFIVGGVCWLLKNLPSLGPNVKLFFEVEEEVRNQLFKTADLAVNPMTQGAGTSLKMFDYLSAGLPVVSTALGARGIAGGKADILLICDVAGFPQAIRSLCADPARRDLLCQKGRSYVEQHFDWKVIAHNMQDYLLKLYDLHKGGSPPDS